MEENACYRCFLQTNFRAVLGKRWYIYPMEKINIISFVGQFVREQRWKFGAITGFSLIWTFDAMFWPYLLRLIVDTLSMYDADRASAWAPLKHILLLGALFWILVEVSFRSRDFLTAKTFPKLEAAIRMTMFDHIQRHSPKYFNEHFSGSLANKIGDMVSSVSMLLRQILIFVFPTLISCIMTVLIFSQINGFLASIVGAWIVMHFTMCAIFTPKCAKYSAIQGEVRSDLMGKVVDSLANNFTVNLFYRFRFEKERIASHQKEEQTKNTQAQMYNAKMFACLSAAWVVVVFSLTLISVLFWMQETISTGEIVQLFYTLWNLSLLIWMVADMAPQFFQSLGIAKQALSVMNDPQDVVDSVSVQDLSVTKGEIVFENVSFQYGDKEIFKDKNLHIRGGEKIGLVGYSGAGKSTFVNLILRFFSVGKGRVLIDGQDIAKVSLKSLRKQTALIPQDPLLFHRSLEENILYGKSDATEEEIVSAAKRAYCHEFVQKTPEGYKSLVGERGAKLSGGEKQRIAIARAMLLKAPILILDEATSALDSVTENYIQESLAQLMENRTTIVVAHRLSTLSRMDRILVFDQGKIIEQGSHEELLKKQGHYAHMWQMQAGGFLPEAPV